MLVDIANEQSQLHSVMVILVNSSFDQSVIGTLSNGVTLKRIERPEGSKNPFYLAKLYWTLLNFSPEIIHVHNAALIDLLRPLSAPTVLTVHGLNVSMPSRYRHYQAVFCISEAVRDDLQKRYPRLTTTLIYNGIRFDDVLKKQSLNQQPFRIVQVGRIDHLIKGHDIHLRAIRRVTDKLGKEMITVDFIGRDAGSTDYLRELAEELGISSQCRFLGPLSRQEVYKSLHQYDLLIQPSRQEGFGLTIVEAMAAKIPVLISDLRGPMEIVGNGQFGYFFKNESDADCADKIIEIIRYAGTHKSSIKLDRSFEYALDNFDIRLTAMKYVTEYSKLLPLHG